MNTDLDITGTYRHYKGNKYELITIGTHTETGEKLVIYTALYEPFGVWVRPYDMFFENIIIEGIKKPRFEKIN
jgi:hypothetical protein